MNRQQELLTSKEVANWLRLAPQTLANKRSRGEGPPALKIDGAVRYSRKVVQAWIDDQNVM